MVHNVQRKSRNFSSASEHGHEEIGTFGDKSSRLIRAETEQYPCQGQFELLLSHARAVCALHQPEINNIGQTCSAQKDLRG